MSCRAEERTRRRGERDNERAMHRHLDRLLGVAVALGCASALGAGCLGEASSSDGGTTYGGTVFNEGFETASKTSYAAANVKLGTGTWNLADALIGTSGSDVKTGSRAARMRNSGHVTMGFDRSAG